MTHTKVGKYSNPTKKVTLSNITVPPYHVEVINHNIKEYPVASIASIANMY